MEDSLEAAALRRGELRRDLEVGEIEERVSDAFELSLERLNDGGQSRRSVRLELALRVGQKLLLVGRVRHAKRGKQVNRLRGCEAMLLDGAKHRLLILVRKPAKRMSSGGPKLALFEPLLCRRAEAPFDLEAPRHPASGLRECVCDVSLRQPVLLFQGGHDFGFIRRGDRAWRCVGQEEHLLVLLGRALSLEDDRDLSVSLLAPNGEALEPVDHLIAVALDGHDAEGKRSKLLRTRSLRAARTKPCVARTESFDRDDVEVSGAGLSLCARGHRFGLPAHKRGRALRNADAGLSERRAGVVSRLAATAIARHPKTWPSSVRIVVDLHFEPSSKQVGRCDLVSALRGQTARTEEAHQPTSGHADRTGRAFEHEVVRDVVIGGWSVVDLVQDLKHEVALCTLP